MNDIQRYLAEEIAEDYADAIITRAEALRRLALMGVSASVAAGLLASFAQQAAGAPAAAGGVSTPSRGGPVHVDEPVPTTSITFAGPEGRTLIGAWAPAGTARGGVLVIHENRGLTAHIRSVAGRFAASGYSALAIDLLSEEGGTDAFQDPAQIPAALAAVPIGRFTADMSAGVTELGRRLKAPKVAAVGFCFGGGMVWQLLASGEGRLDAAAPFYGPFPAGGDLSDAKAAVLGIYGELDSRVNATRAAAEAALEEAKLVHELVTFAGADHAFFNDTGPRYSATAAAAAYEQVLDWFERYLARKPKKEKPEKPGKVKSK